MMQETKPDWQHHSVTIIAMNELATKTSQSSGLTRGAPGFCNVTESVDIFQYVRQLAAAGCQAVLVAEPIMKAADPVGALQAS
jgi:indole-3-glycerol phosphate synthase